MSAKIPTLPPEHFIPQASRDNYDQVARDRASVTGSTPKTEMAALASQWLVAHEVDPQAGYDHLAAWADGRDPGTGVTVNPAAAAKSRAIESARRDPSTALAGDPDVVAAALEGLQVQADQVSPSGSGSLPNPGSAPIDVPADYEGTAPEAVPGPTSPPKKASKS